MIEIFLLVSALCVDEMVASMAYGADGIKLGIRQILLMNLVCSSFLGVSLGAGTLFSGLIQEQTARAVGFVCLLFWDLSSCSIITATLLQQIKTNPAHFL